MTRIFQCGFETGDKGAFDSLHPLDYPNYIPVVTTQKRTGNYSLFVDLWTSVYAQKTLTTPLTEFYMRFGFRYASSAATGYIIRFYDFWGGEADLQCTLRMNGTTKVLEVTRGTTLLASSPDALVANRWYCIELHIKVDAAAGIFDVKLDGTQVIDFDGNTAATASINIGCFRVGYVGVTDRLAAYYDDFAINDTAGSVNNSWPGQGGIYGVVPNEPGEYAQFTPSADANWQCADGVPPTGDTVYNKGATVDLKDSYGMTPLPGAGAISAISHIMRVRQTEPGDSEVARLLRIAGTDYQGADVPIDAGYQNVIEIIELNPADSEAWEADDINAIQAGVVVR